MVTKRVPINNDSPQQMDMSLGVGGVFASISKEVARAKNASSPGLTMSCVLTIKKGVANFAKRKADQSMRVCCQYFGVCCRDPMTEKIIYS